MFSTRPARLLLVALLGWGLAACQSQPSATAPTTAPAATAAPTAAPAAATAAPTDAPAAATAAPTAAAQADLSGIKTYLTQKTGELQQATALLKAASDRYYGLAQAANFDYAALWRDQGPAAKAAIEEARAAWMKASPGYEQMEGIVAGTPALAQFDVDLDAGASGSEGGDTVVSFDLALPNGTTLPKPGNLFGVTESTLWGTDPAYRAEGVEADFDGDGTVEFSETLPDANVLKGGVDTLDAQAAALTQAAAQWQPTPSDAFTSLVVMVPTMNEYFASWKSSRFVAGEQSEQRDFVAISRLADIQDILSSLQVVHKGVSPLIQQADPAEDRAIGEGLERLSGFVGGIYQQEQGGKRFTPEEADVLGVEAQEQATAITGRVTQIAAQLQIPIQE